MVTKAVKDSKDGKRILKNCMMSWKIFEFSMTSSQNGGHFECLYYKEQKSNTLVGSDFKLNKYNMQKKKKH